MKFLTKTWVLFIFIVLIAGVFRLLVLQYAEFKGDEAINLLLASRPIFGHQFPPASQASSAGILNFPLLNYFLFPIIIFTLYPPAISFIIALINTLTIAGFFLLFKKYHGKLIALIASLTISISPWAILYSRKIWAQDFLLPLSFPFFLSIYKVLEGKRHYWVLFGISSMLLMQIHQIALVIPLLVFLGLFKKAIASWKYLLLGILIGLIPTLHYFWYMASHICFSCSNALADRLSLRSYLTFFRPLQILSIGDFHVEFGNDFAIFATSFPLFYKVSKLSYLAYLLTPLGMLFFWLKEKTYKLFALVTFAYTLLLFAAGIEPLMHYYILLIPFLAIFIGFFISLLIQNKKLTIVGIAILIIYSLSLMFFDIGFLLFLSEKGGLAGEYGSGYINTETEIEKKIQTYKYLPNYKELVLLYESPLEYFHGYMPLGKMIFPYESVKRDETMYEKQFIKTSTNPLLEYSIFSYYTQSQNPSWQYVVSLKEKSRQNSVFDFIYQKVLNEYLSVHFKNIYETPDFLALYPRHWNKQEINNGVLLSDGEVSLQIIKVLPINPDSVILGALTQEAVTIAGKRTNVEFCNNKHVLCGIVTSPTLIRANYYQFSLSSIKPEDIPDDYKKIFKEIVDSVIPLQ